MGGKAKGPSVSRVLLMTAFAVAVGIPCQTPIAQTRVAAEPTSRSVDAQRVTLNINDALLSTVIQEIARQAKLNPLYERSIISPDARVTVHVRQVSAIEAFSAALQGTGLLADIQSTGQVIIVRDAAATVAGGVVIGKVTDAKTKQPLAGVAIAINGKTKGVTTTEDGRYRMSGVASGQYTLTFRRLGYTRQTRPVTVLNNETATVDVVLEPSTSQLDQVVVTGTVVATQLKAVPNAVTVITAKQIEQRGITRIDQLFRGDIPGLFALNQGSFSSSSNAANAPGLNEVVMFSRGATAIAASNSDPTRTANPIKTYVDGIEMADSKYLSQIDPRSIDRIEVLTGPQASTIYGSNAINGVMQIFTKRGTTRRPQITLNTLSGVIQNNFSSGLAPTHVADARLTAQEGSLSYAIGGSYEYAGAWTPAKRTSRVSAYAGGRMKAGVFTVDGSARQGVTTNRQTGTILQGETARYESGEWAPRGTLGVPMTSTLNGRTVGLTAWYAPVSWWSHELVVGSDASDTESLQVIVGYRGASDSLLSLVQAQNIRASQRYSTTAQFALAASAHLTTTVGIDHWRTRGSSRSAASTVLTGTLGSPVITRTKPGKNSGSFIQAQFAFGDALFLTYGLRAEWNPNYGDDANPNLAPRYGLAYTDEIGFVTAKLRASYGRSTRPPSESQKLAAAQTSNTFIGLYGPYTARLANPDLGPEFQQGGEGGLELYFENRGSIVITRYNQTVDALIVAVSGVDSVRSLKAGPTLASSTFRDASNYGYAYQSQFLNVGSIRNQGWELQGTLNTGPFTTTATYSWTKSRILGITTRYRSLLTNSVYQSGRSMNFIPEHTWALATTYARSGTTMSVAVNGTGQLYRYRDDLYYAAGYGASVYRILNDQPRVGLPATYRPVGRGYAMVDLNVAYRLSSSIDGVIQLQNLTNYYQNDFSPGYATMGRQSKIGLRVRL